EEDRESVATHARDGVFASHAVDEPRGDDLKETISDGVSQRVVDEFELIEVEEHDRRATTAPLRMRERDGDAIAEKQAVRQECERVVIRLIFDLLGGALAIGDVDDRSL